MTNIRFPIHKIVWIALSLLGVGLALVLTIAYSTNTFDHPDANLHRAHVFGPRPLTSHFEEWFGTGRNLDHVTSRRLYHCALQRVSELRQLYLEQHAATSTTEYVVGVVTPHPPCSSPPAYTDPSYLYYEQSEHCQSITTTITPPSPPTTSFTPTPSLADSDICIMAHGVSLYRAYARAYTRQRQSWPEDVALRLRDVWVYGWGRTQGPSFTDLYRAHVVGEKMDRETACHHILESSTRTNEKWDGGDDLTFSNVCEEWSSR